MNSAISVTARTIRLIVFDVDGTLTDGSIILGEKEEWKAFNIQDGLGIRLLIKAGIEVAFITGRRSGAVRRRAKELGVQHVIQSARDKGVALRKLGEVLKITREQIAAMGDDLPDLALFRETGLKLAVADAASELRAAAHWISKTAGGCGAAREAAEMILKTQGKWSKLVAEFTK